MLEEVIDDRNVDRLLIISDHGALIVFTTQFGMCEYILRREHIRYIYVSISVMILRVLPPDRQAWHRRPPVE